MSDDTTLGQAAARRYAEALAAAAATEERVSVLVEQLAEAEWLTRTAEAESGALLSRADLPLQIYTATGEAPDESVKALLSLDDGSAFVRDTTRPYEDEHVWIAAHADPRSTALHAWPLERGPYLAFLDTWGYATVLRDVATGHAVINDLRKVLATNPGYDDPENRSPWHRPDLAGALARVLATEQAKTSEQRQRAWAAEEESRRLRRHLASDEALIIFRRVWAEADARGEHGDRVRQALAAVVAEGVTA